MTAIWKLGSMVIMSALVGPLGVASAQSANTNNPSYQSSITVGDSGEGEHAEAARYMELAKIDVGKAMAAAQARVPGRVLSTALDNENGNLVYSVVMIPTAGGAAQDVKVDAGNGAVLHIDAGNGREEHDDGDKD